MVKIAIVVGHTEARQGAPAKSPIGQNEYIWNKDLADKMVAHAAHLGGVEARIFLRDRIGVKGAYREARDWGADGAMELHFNSAGPTATGTEMLFGTSHSEDLAAAVQDATVSVLGLRDRGLRDARVFNNQRGLNNLVQMKGRPSILTEAFFGSNASDCAVAQGKKDDLAVAQIEAMAGVLLAGDGDDGEWEVLASALNVRGGPGTEFETLDWGPLPRGAKVDVVAWEGRWAKISADQGVAFVHGDYLG